MSTDTELIRLTAAELATKIHSRE
ncbi:MAG: hypothetical protein QOG76_7111, partial [Pseudonocardiales bacterium]|nr:hypothetical protein [Pseudonocardiales bacterium]